MKEKIFYLSRQIISHELINGSFYIFAGSILGSVFSFLLNLFLARTLSYAEYGTITTLVAFVGLITIPTQSITTVIVQYATNFFSKKEYAHASYLYKKGLLGMISIGSLIFVIFVIFSHVLSNFLHISTIEYIFIAGILAGLGYIAIVNGAFLQSLLRFGYISVINFVGNLSKIAFGIFFVILGFKIYGVLAALIIAGIIPIILSFLPLRYLLKEKDSTTTFSKKGMVSYGVSVAIATLSLSSLTSTDLILVKHFFLPTQAGLYAGLSLMGKSIFYLTAPISTVLFPVIINRYNQGKNFNKTFYLALGLVFLPSLCVSIFYFLFPHFTIQFFLGGRGYFILSPYVWLYGLFITLFSLINVCVTFFLSLKKTKIAIPLCLGAIAQIVDIWLFHTGFYQVIIVSLITSSILLIVILLYYLKSYGKSEK